MVKSLYNRNAHTSNLEEGISALLSFGALASDEIVFVLVSFYHSLTFTLLLSTCLQGNVSGVIGVAVKSRVNVPVFPFAPAVS